MKTHREITAEEEIALMLSCVWGTTALCFIGAIIYGIVYYPDRTLAINHVIIAAGILAAIGIPLLIWLKNIARRLKVRARRPGR